MVKLELFSTNLAIVWGSHIVHFLDFSARFDSQRVFISRPHMSHVGLSSQT